MTDIVADFELQPETQINADFEVQNQPQIGADFLLAGGTILHDHLIHREYPDQHPISAITGLQEVLDKLWTFTYEQATASDVWEIQHNLGRNPSVVIVDSAGNVFYPAVQYIDENNIVVTMNGATTGKAYLN